MHLSSISISISRARQRQRGAALLEWLVGVPVVLLIGMGGLQWALVMQARQALIFATEQAVRHAARDHGRGEAVNRGLAVGLRPFWLSPTIAQASAQLAQGYQAGWIAWQRLHPQPDVFSDFGEPARTRAGDLIAGDLEIPNDNLRFRSPDTGRQSGISVQDANRYALELTYGITLSVPLISALTVRVMEIVDGCRAPDPLLLVTTNLGTPSRGTAPRPWTCAIYRAPQVTGGRTIWRLPVRVRAEAWMHSGLRQSSATDSATADGQARVIQSRNPVVGTDSVTAGVPDVFSAPPVTTHGSDTAPAAGAGGAPQPRSSIGDELLGRNPVHRPGQCDS